MSTLSHLSLTENEVLTTESGEYQVQKFLGRGSYGTVAECKKLSTKEVVAVKFIRTDLYGAGKREIEVFKKLRKLDPDKSNMVRFIEDFTYNKHTCLAFEMLGESIFDFMQRRKFEPFQVSEIRMVAQQMLVTLNALKSIGLAHTDIKPDNIMLVNHEEQPFKVKLIDFGMASMATKLNKYNIQALGYRAPEVILGLPLNEALDTWALGAVLAFMYTARHLYPSNSEYEVIRVMVQMQGLPEDHVLESGKHSKSFFTKSNGTRYGIWRLNTPAEYTEKTGIKTERRHGLSDRIKTFDSLMMFPKAPKGPTEFRDILAFISFLKQMLHVDPKKRITPAEALDHRFITLKHFRCGTSSAANVSAAQTAVPRRQLNEKQVQHCVTSTEVVHVRDESNEMSSVESEDSSELVTVKSKGKYFRGIRKFFSRIFKCFRFRKK